VKKRREKKIYYKVREKIDQLYYDNSLAKHNIKIAKEKREKKIRKRKSRSLGEDLFFPLV
jgi:hypothetical protein